MPSDRSDWHRNYICPRQVNVHAYWQSSLSVTMNTCVSQLPCNGTRGDIPVAGSQPRSPRQSEAESRCSGILTKVNPRDRLRSASRRVTDPAETLAQQVTERVVDLVVSALDINEIVASVDLNAVLSRIDLDALLGRMDINALLTKVDVNALMSRMDVNALLGRVDINVLLEQVDVNDIVRRVDIEAVVQNTDLGAVIATSTGGVASEVLDAARSQAVGLDRFVDRWIRRLLHQEPGPDVPPALLPPPAAAEAAP
jgi:hypothetical protein